MAAPKEWKKILYEDQNKPDNYVDDKSFLRELKKNKHIRSYEYWPTVSDSGCITQQISSVCIFVVIFMYMDNKQLKPDELFIVTTILTIIGYICYVKLENSSNTTRSNRTVCDDMKTSIMFGGFSFSLSPVLVSLTETISTDTIYAMTSMMMIANILFYNYSADQDDVPGTLSLNAATFASICLASRLNTTWHAFSIVLFSFEWFALWPLLRHRLKTIYPKCNNTITVVLGLLALVFLLSTTIPGAILFLSIHIFINFICPAFLKILQVRKNNIYGPWDEAQPGLQNVKSKSS
ncbi:hypothetical protein LOTGIDRAFT_120032 [Lottia gigantea]|uniref:Phosphatidylinositol N-acetylglucosaminyltransferase subunit C n=1 Tax=Lottia gigantea TaxID=225164 RepID=V3ZN48_LOTGI|nr:hypothetical protein LOTGIDRAFT_120032 [Lottia gigantea]ESO92813.1 hypothetical protein LOTGIDRAFT_120032 [Lottia gigantea]